jgi:cytidine deaminase
VSLDRPPLERPAAMGDADAELLATARALLEQCYREGRHEVATAWRMSDGGVVTGVHVDGSARRSAVCAEGAAASNAIAYAARRGVAAEVEAVVSVLRKPAGSWHVIEPCGVCAELITDYWPDARVWGAREGAVVGVQASELLPLKFRRTW